MATFDKIRKLSPWVLALFAILFVGFMVLSDSNLHEIVNSNADAQNAVLANINGDEIRYLDFEKKVKEAVEKQKSQMQDPEAEVDESQIRRQVWSQMVDDVLMKQQASATGIVINDDFVTDLLLNFTPAELKKNFSDSNGVFNRKLFIEVMTNPEGYFSKLQMEPERKKAELEKWREQINGMSEYYRESMLRQMVNSAVNVAGGIVSPTYAKLKYTGENSAASVSYLMYDVRNLKKEDFKISDKEAEEYYNKNKEYYEQEAQRKIRYISFPVEPSQEDSLRAERRVQQMMDLTQAADSTKADSIFSIRFNEFGGTVSPYTMLQDVDPAKSPLLMNLNIRQVAGPFNLGDGTYFFRLDDRRTGGTEVVKASHILVNFGDNKDSARKAAEDILKKAKSGADFGELATEFSKDPGSARNGGDLGYFGKGRMVKEFEEAAYGLGVGDISGLVESQFGFHIIKVTDKKSEEIKYSEIKISPKLTGATTNMLKRSAQDFKEQVSNGAKFEDLAKKFNKASVETQFFDKFRPILGSQYLTDLVFNGNEGDVIGPIQLKNYGYLVAQVTTVRERGTAPFEDKKEEIKVELTRQKMLDKLQQDAKIAYSRLSGLDSLSKAPNVGIGEPVQTVNIKDDGVIPGGPRDVIFTHAAMKADKGVITGPLKGEAGVYIMQVHERSVPGADQVKTGLGDYLRTSRATARTSTYFQWFSHFKKRSEIEDFRHKYYSEY